MNIFLAKREGRPSGKLECILKGNGVQFLVTHYPIDQPHFARFPGIDAPPQINKLLGLLDTLILRQKIDGAPSGTKPTWRNTCVKRAFSDAITASQASAMLHPIPATAPRTPATTGFSMLARLRTIR